MRASIPTETGRFYEFGNFRLDPAAKILCCDEKPVALTPKVFDTLQFFVENPGRLLEKDELMQTIWQERIVEESNLTFNIKTLRRALNDDPNQPRFIETVRGRGYRFIAEVQEVSISVAVPRVELRQTQPELLKPQPKEWSYLSITVVAAVVVALLAVGWFARSRPTASTLSAPILSTSFESEKLFSTGGNAVITPDGRYVAYTSETGGKESIWLRKLESAENIQIVPPADEQILGLAISHDVNTLYFVRGVIRNSSILYRVATFGGIPAKVADNPQGWISVSPDNRRISFVRCKFTDDDFCSLFVIDGDGRNERRLLTRKRPFRIADNRFSPDGKSIAFAAGQSWNGGSDFRLMQLDLASGVESEISRSRTFFDISSLTWLPDQTGLFLTAKDRFGGRSRIWHVSAATGEVQALTKDATDYIGLSTDKAADKLVARSVGNTFGLYLGSAENIQNGRNLATAHMGFGLAPNGKIVYEGNDGDIWTINQDGTEQRQLTNNSFVDFFPIVSPDGRHIFFTSNRTGSNHVWRMRNDGSDSVQISHIEGGYPRFVSPDGNWVYFESGLHQTLWRASTGGVEETQVFDEKVFNPSFSPDGKFFSYIVHDDSGTPPLKLAVVSIDDRNVKSFKLVANGPDPSSAAWATAWASDNKSVYYITTNGSRNSLWRQFLDKENPHLLGELGDEEVASFAVTPDGAGIIFIRGKWMDTAVMMKGLK